MGGGGLPIPLPTGRAGGGIGTLIVLLIVFLVFGRGAVCGGGGAGIDTGDQLNPFPDVQQAPSGENPVEGGPDPQAEQFDFVNFLTLDLEGFWGEQFQASGQRFQPAKLVVFSGGTGTGCGQGSAATGPFYCPLDQTAYIDLGFFDQLSRQLGAPGDFAQAYVLAHEYGHHVQHLLGIDQQVQEETQAYPDEQNELSVRLELQADCLAGVWGRSAFEEGALEEGDLDEGLNAASQIGDDRIQEQTQGRTDPESYTHGTAEQRSRWLRTGYDDGNLEACDTFSGDI
jgi:predicted metalloprotease